MDFLKAFVVRKKKVMCWELVKKIYHNESAEHMFIKLLKILNTRIVLTFRHFRKCLCNG